MITFSKLGEFGQLGNQMFQIASTIGIATKNKQGFVFPEWKYSQYFKNRLPIGSVSSPEIFDYQSSQYKDIVLYPDRNYDLFGYYISEKYFEKVENKIAYYFQPLDIYIKERIDGIAIHVRGTDALRNQVLYMPEREYYDKALDLLPKFVDKVIFTDDPPYARAMFPEGWPIYRTSIAIEDMFYMSRFHYQINAVSTFSWWAGWLGEDIWSSDIVSTNKVIIAPKTWYENPNIVSYDHVPERWIRL